MSEERAVETKHGAALCLLAASVGSVMAAAPAAQAPSGAQRVQVAAISFVPEKLNPADNADRLEQALREAAAGGARIAVAPEGVIDGYIVNESFAGKFAVERMREVAVVMGRVRRTVSPHGSVASRVPDTARGSFFAGANAGNTVAFPQRFPLPIPADAE